MSGLFRALPAVDQALKELEKEQDLQDLPRPLLKDLVNEFLDLLRQEIRSGVFSEESELALQALKGRMSSYVRMHSRPHFRRVINATGVVVHTNLGRSLLAESAIEAVTEACRYYSNLEFSLETGKRGSRYSHVERLLCELSGAEAGLVVNNNASAVLLVLDTLAKCREVIVSRGQLVEIGGSFRIPEVMAKSGAKLYEVGATNRTHLYDYEQAIGPETAALLKVHTSNYQIIGFHKEVPLKELAGLADKYELPVIEDLGSGNLFSFPPESGLCEPTVQQTIQDGAAVVTFSGDKLLGGPQAGIILGRREYIQCIKKNPLNRAVRIDKMTLAALEATLRLYKDPERAREKVPTLNMISKTQSSLKAKAKRLATRIRQELGTAFNVQLRTGASRVGGGASPESDLPTTLVALEPKQNAFGLERLREELLKTDPPLVGRIEGDCFCLDPRTLQANELGLTIRALKQAIHNSSSN